MPNLTIEKIRNIISGRALDHIKNVDRMNKQGRNLVFQTFPGRITLMEKPLRL